VVDLQLQIIPNRIVYPAIFASVPLLAVAALGQHDWWPLERALISAAAAWFALLVIHLVSPGGMGFGDVRLSFLLGLFLGWLGYGHVLTGLFLGFLLGAVVGLLLVALRLRKRTDHVPFGPFLAVGAALAILVGDPVVHLLVRGG
jgi:leader peptidase (prepilin peptidase)/N-methyltransferase